MGSRPNLPTPSNVRVVKYVLLVALVLSLFPGPIAAAPLPAPTLQTSTFPVPAVAIHVSELTLALETMPATPPTPTGSGYSGFQWWTTAWHYYVMYESLEEALRSDGTPFTTVSDGDISAGRLLNPDGSPKYPIVISLASEAIADTEIVPLRSYVAAGGFLFVGSSAFTRNPNGTTRGDFALANEVGLHMANSSLQNWYQNTTFRKVTEHRLVSHIPTGTLTWRMPLYADQQPWIIFPTYVIHGANYVWQVQASSASVIANGDSGPLLAIKSYGQGQFIYHGALEPLVGHGGYDAGMYAYVIYRSAIEWAFESANLPLVKLSPWRYPYDAAFVVRHDFENTPSLIQSIEASAQAENAVGAKGDYYFTTGTVRVGSEDTQLSNSQKTQEITSLRRAVSLYGATIGSHNGGLKNPSNTSLSPADYQYWHWGPDEALDTHPAGYANGKAYAYTSIYTSFLDVQGWLSGLDNGRLGCGAASNCPRTWVSPFFNGTREDSYDILEQLGSITMGDQKIGPFPHWTLSTQTAGKRYDHVTLPVSDWYIGADVAQSMEDGHTASTVQALVDYYYSLGALINLYGHSSSTGGLQQQYVTYSAAKPRIWATNAVGVYDWWKVRSNVIVTPTYGISGNTIIAGASITGAIDPETSIELVIPSRASSIITGVQVFINNAPANPADYRMTDHGMKVKVGASGSTVEVHYTFIPLNAVVFWDDLDPVKETWTHAAAQGTDDWSLSTNHSHSPSTAYFSSEPSTVKDDYLLTRAFVVPVNAQLSFWHTYQLEPGYDGAVVEISTDGGATFTDLQSRITQGPYTGQISNVDGSPIHGRWAWTGGSLGTMSQVVVDLSSYTGQNAIVRFRLATDVGTAGAGWYIDDIRVAGSSTQSNYTLAVNVVGNGSVVKTPDLPAFQYGSVVTLTATPTASWSFAGWSGDLTGSVNPQSLTISGDKVVTATFIQNGYTLAVNVAGNGTVVRNPDRAAYNLGEAVTLTATPAAGWTFAGWSGDLTGSVNPQALTISGNEVITATFTQNAYMLTVNVVGSGTAAKNPDQATYHYGDVVTLSATANPGQSFAGWSGDLTGNANPQSITITGNKVVTATFTTSLFSDDFTRQPSAPSPLSPWTAQLGTWTVSNGVLQGSNALNQYACAYYSPQPAWTDYTVQGRFQFPAGAFGGGLGGQLDPATGAHYGAWIYPDGSAGGSNVLKLVKFRDWTTWSGLPMQQVNLPSVGIGWHTLQMAFNGNRIRVYYDGNLMIDVTDNNYDSRPAYLSGGISLDAWTYTTSYLMTVDDIVVQSASSNPTYTLTVSVTGNGSVARNPNQATYNSGDVVTLTATPAAGWNFTGWSGDLSGSANPQAITITGNKVVTATFTQNQYSLAVNVVGSGSVTKNPDQATYNPGDVVTLTATPAAGWNFTGWNGDLTDSANPQAITITGNKVVTATFTQQSQYTLAVNVAGSGSVTKNPDQAAYNPGDVVTLTATPAAGWSFAGWSGDLTGSTNPQAITLNGNKVVTATFTQQSQYTLAVNVVGSGSVAKNPDQASYNPGTVVTLTATPAAGWSFAGWSGDLSGSTNPQAITLNGNKVVTATFTQNQYSLAVNVVGSGSVAKNPDQATYNTGTVVTLTATPAAGWSFAGWSGDLTGSTNPQAFTITGNKIVTATFTQQSQYTLAINIVGSGSVGKNPNQAAYNSGDVVTLTATPAAGWNFTGWSGDLSGSANPQAITITGNKVVTATFTQQSQYTLAINIVGSGSVGKNPDQAAYNFGTVVTLTATPAAGWTFAGWSGDLTDSANPQTLTIRGNQVVTATFSDIIFADSFESGNLSAWSSAATDFGNLSVTAAAALVGTRGLQAVINDNNSMYVNDDTPNAEPRYRARFYFDPNSISMANGNAHYIFYGYMGTTTVVLRIEFRFSSRNYQLRAGLNDDSGTWRTSDWFNISDAPHFVEIAWQAATAAGANNGYLTLWIDGAQRANLTRVNNDTRRIDRVRLGPVSGIDNGTRGTYYFDAFESRRQTYIGP